jgi:hypothetical protein
MFTLGNWVNALSNATMTSDHRSDHRRQEIQASNDRSSQRSQLSQRRQAQVQLAGEDSPDAIEGRIQQAKAKDARRWQVTEGCSPEKITAGASRAFCAEVAKLTAVKAAATKRDEIDVALGKLGDKVEEAGETPTSADPFGDSLGDLMAIFGVKVTDEGKRAFSRSKDYIQSALVELSSSFGPSAIFAMFAFLVAVRPAPVERREPSRPARRPEAVASSNAPIVFPEPVLPTPADDPVDNFRASSRLELCADASMPAGEMWGLWNDYCAEHGLEPGSQKSFGTRMQKWFVRDNNNNRPRYLGVRARFQPQKPKLRIVADTTVKTA